MKYLILILKGMLFGIANLIPGVSGGTMAVITGVYEEFIDSINHLFTSFKKSMLFLLPYGIGIILSVFLVSKLISLCLSNLPIPTMSLFVGMIAGGIPSIVRPVKTKVSAKNILFVLIGLAIVLVFFFIPSSNSSITNLRPIDYFLLFVSGFIASIAMVLPGISGMMIFMLFGYYDTLMNTLASLSNLSLFLENCKVLLPIAFGVFIGLFSACKVFSILLKKYPVASIYVILGFVIASILCVIYKMFGYPIGTLDIFLGIAFMVIGFIVSIILSNLNKKEGESLLDS